MATTTNASQTFTPTDFFGSNNETPNYSEFNPNYTTDVTTSNNQLQMLQDALQYVQGNPAGMSSQDASFYAQQLQNDINEQQNVSSYDTAQTNLNTAVGTQQNIGNLLTQMQESPNNLNAGQWSQISQALQAAGDPTISSLGINLSTGGPGTNVPGAQPYDPNTPLSQIIQQYVNSGNPGQVLGAIGSQLSNNGVLQNYISNLNSAPQSALTTAQQAMLNGTTLTSPNYQDDLNALNQYYYGGNGQTGAIQEEQNQAMTGPGGIYQQNYNLRNGINEQMAASGNLSSGVRQSALSNQNAAAITAASGVSAQANQAANSAIANLNQQNLASGAQQQDLVTSLKLGGAAGLLSGATNSAVQNYNTNTQSQMQNAIQQGETGLAQQQANQAQEGSIMGTLGSGIGTLGGSAMGTSSLSNPFGMFAQNLGGLV